jgi:beta-lactamase superfamily II metal-dependent hydrolase
VFKIDMLPGGNGDALWIEYGASEHTHRVLVDGGTRSSWKSGLHARVAALPPEKRTFELMIVTHIDADHIDGALELLQDDELGARVDEIWFNGWRHLPDTKLEELGPITGERLTNTIISHSIPWNTAFDGHAVAVRDDRPPPVRHLPGGLSLTVLSPTALQLSNLKPVWLQVVQAAGLDPDEPRKPTEPDASAEASLEALGSTIPDVDALLDLPFKQDTAEPNGSSIVVLIEYGGRSALLTGDCFPSVVLASLQRLSRSPEDDRLHVDAVKVPHHGSRSNVSFDLLKALQSPRLLFSSNGSRTQHPHPESVARALASAKSAVELTFNYRTTYNEIWDDDNLRAKHNYATTYAEPTEPATVVL